MHDPMQSVDKQIMFLYCKKSYKVYIVCQTFQGEFHGKLKSKYMKYTD